MWLRSATLRRLAVQERFSIIFVDLQQTEGQARQKNKTCDNEWYGYARHSGWLLEMLHYADRQAGRSSPRPKVRVSKPAKQFSREDPVRSDRRRRDQVTSSIEEELGSAENYSYQLGTLTWILEWTCPLRGCCHECSSTRRLPIASLPTIKPRWRRHAGRADAACMCSSATIPEPDLCFSCKPVHTIRTHPLQRAREPLLIQQAVYFCTTACTRLSISKSTPCRSAACASVRGVASIHIFGRSSRSSRAKQSH